MENGNNSLIITSSSCYRMSEETLLLIDCLPEKGSKEFYIQAMFAMGIEKAMTRIIFDKLVIIGALIINFKQKKNIFKKIFLNIIRPEIKLLSSQRQKKTLEAMRIIPAGKEWFEKNKKNLKVVLFSFLFISLMSIFFSFIISFTGMYAILAKMSVGHAKSAYLLAIVFFGSFVHEIGHSFAAASANIGLRPIGFSIYLFYPVFYTNVSGMEKLSLHEKVLIDCGGFIAQSIYLLIFLLLWFFTRNMLFLESIRWISLIMAFNFNPLLRTDGYWLYKDIRKEFKNSKIVIYLHYIYIAAFFSFTIYLFYYLFGKIEHVYDLLLIAYKNPATLFHEGYGYVYGQAYKIILGPYLILMFFIAGSRRLQEVSQEWLDLRKQTTLR
ncbi:MAG: hypothetical protein HQK51_11115 [Oligoflexia bacterium]|nr:hypothetical protein [Oligoflexia bacterium]